MLGAVAFFSAFCVLLFVFSAAFAQTRTDLKGIVPGNELGWEIQELRASVVVSKPTILNLQIYSPGFDPTDYRSSLKGKNELGDERYDKGKGQVRAEFVLLRNGKEIAKQTYGIEPHRWVLFFRGQVEPGIYQLNSRFWGLGKNAFRYRIQTSAPQAAELLVDPALQLYDVRARAGYPLSVATIRGNGWEEPFALEVLPGALPLKVRFYDEDGPGEMLARVRLPDGRVESRQVSGDKSWAYYEINQPGVVRFGFRQNPKSKQYSNTIGFWVDACLEVGKEFFRVVPPRPVTVSVVDTNGRVLDVPLEISGDRIREVRLSAVPGNYELVRLQQQGGEQLGPQQLRFGCAGGSVQFVLQRKPISEPPIQTAGLELEAYLALPDGEQPLDMAVKVGEKLVQLSNGRANLAVPPGLFPLIPQIEGARVEGLNFIALNPGETKKVAFKVYPEVKLTLEANPTTFKVGEETTLVARATTAFPRLLPADLQLGLPNCLEPLGATGITTPISNSREGVLEVKAKAVCKGEFAATASLQPWNSKAEAQIKVLQPATFTLSKETLTPEIAVGSQVVYRLQIKNIGDQAGEVRVRDPLAPGLQGQAVDQVVSLQAGEEKIWRVPAILTGEAPPIVTNKAVLLDAAGETLTEATASVKVLRPKAELSRSLDKRMVVPGEEIEVKLSVSNNGQAPLAYSLSDTYPEWIEPVEPVEFKGQLLPGASATHTYKAKVRFGPQAESQFQATLSSNGGNLTASDSLKRVLLDLEKALEPGRVLIGSDVAFIIKVKNPTDHAIAIDLQEAPDPDLNLQLPDNLKLTLQAGEARELRLVAKPQKVGELDNQVTAFVGGTPASFPAKVTLAVLPILEPVRLSTVTMDFEIRGQGERVLLTHLPPEAAAYELGSARLNGNPIPDPRVDEQGRLYFELPFQAQGVLTYQLRHRDRLPALAEPTITLRTGDREVYVQGQQTYAAWEKAKPLEAKTREGFIKEPLPGTLFRVDKAKVVLQMPYGLESQLSINGEAVDSKSLGEATYDSSQGIQRLEYYGLPLAPGRNLIAVNTAAGSDQVEVFLAGKPIKLVVRPVRLLADGRTPVELEILALDANDLPSGFGPLTVQVSPEPLEPDAFPQESGYQILMRNGRAMLKLKPLASPVLVRLRLAFGELTTQAEFYALGRQNSLWQVQGSIGARFGESIQVFGLARGYLETPLENGMLRGAMDGSIKFKEGLPQVQNGLKPQPDPTGRFPLSGSGSEPQLGLASDDPVALRYDEDGFGVGYYAGQLSVYGVSELPQGTALRAEARGDLSLQGFVGWLPAAIKTDEIVPDGTRYYKLSVPAEQGSEQVILLVGTSQARLEPLKDYVLDGPSGTLTLAKPLWFNAPDFRPVRLRVTYAPLNAAREMGYGVGVRYKVGGFSVGAGAAFLAGQGWRYGVETTYQSEDFGLKTNYSRGSAERAGLEFFGKNGLLEAGGSLTYEGKVQGQAKLGYSLSDVDKVSLEHQASDTNQTGLLYTRRLNDSFSVGGGLGYTWETASLAGLGRLGFNNGALNAELTHAQPFSVSRQAQTRLRSTYALDTNLFAEADVIETWGFGISGSIGLKQKLEAANLSLSYQLPGASGEGNRARFGVEVPLPLSERWSLNANAGYERSLATGQDQLAFGLATRYQTDIFSAALGGETALVGGQTKVVLRAGATGQIDSQQVLSFDATYQVVPLGEGRFTLAYALRGRDVSLLTYSRLISGSEGILEGSVAANYLPDPSFQLRPSAAYRLKLNDPAGNTYQLGLGANYYFTDFLGIGAAAYYQFQPGTSTNATAFSLEGSYRIVDGLWFNLGYTFGGFVGLTPDTYPGFYLRLDFLGGGR